MTQHLRPRNVVETGVLHGVTSHFILAALERNGVERLWSIDLPPLEPVFQDEIGIAVTDRFRPRWSYIKGTSKQRLPGIISKLGQIDLFIHDSLHSAQNVRYEIDRAFAAFARVERSSSMTSIPTGGLEPSRRPFPVTNR